MSICFESALLLFGKLNQLQIITSWILYQLRFTPLLQYCLRLHALCLTVLDETTLLLEAVIGSYCVLIIFKHEEECKWVDYCKHFWSSSFLTSKLMRFCVIVYLRHLQIQNIKVVIYQIQKLNKILVVMIINRASLDIIYIRL